MVLLEPGPIRTRIRENSIPHFERWIDWRGSARAAQYERTLLRRLYAPSGPDAFELEPRAVSAKLIRALEARRPRARYFVTRPTYAAEILRRAAPTALRDALLARG